MKKLFLLTALLGVIGLATIAADCTVINIALTSVGGKDVFAGEIKNESGVNILQHKVRVTFLNSSNAVLETKTVDPCLRSVKSGTTSPFSAQSSLDDDQTATGLARMANFAEDAGFKVGNTVNGDFTITVTSAGLDENGKLVVTGTIKNNDNDTIEDPRVCVVVRSNSGAVIYVKVNTSVTDLDEDESANWTIEIAGLPESTSTINKVDAHADALDQDGKVIAPESDTGNSVEQFGEAEDLAVQTQPSTTGTGGTALATQPKIKIVDNNGDTVLSADNTVTLAIKAGTGTAGAALTCDDTTVDAVNGVATFAGCKIDKAGVGYVLTATATGLTSVDTNAITISVGAAAKLAFTTQPSAAVAFSVPFAQQPVVSVQDAGGNTVTTDGTTVVTLTKGGAGAGNLAGCTTGVTVINGVATFAGCNITAAGTNTLIANSAPAYTSATSGSIVTS